MLLERWREDASRIPGSGLKEKYNPSVSSELNRIFGLMSMYYGEPWRKYHTLEHIEVFQNALDNMELCPLTVRIAGWFHDIYYAPGYAQSEECSADIAEKWLVSLGGVSPLFRTEVRSLILSTKHDGLCPKSMAEAFMRDADLWSLGDSDRVRFRKTQEQIRAEFPFTVDSVYKRARQDVFTKMCKTAIYWSGKGKEREALARSNLLSEGIVV